MPQLRCRRIDHSTITIVPLQHCSNGTRSSQTETWHEKKIATARWIADRTHAWKKVRQQHILPVSLDVSQINTNLRSFAFVHIGYSTRKVERIRNTRLLLLLLLTALLHPFQSGVHVCRRVFSQVSHADGRFQRRNTIGARGHALVRWAYGRKTGTIKHRTFRWSSSVMSVRFAAVIRTPPNSFKS